MDVGRGVLDDRQNRPSPVGYERIADPWIDAAVDRVCVLHGHVFTNVIAVERRGVEHLTAVGIDHLDVLASLDVCSFTVARAPE